MLELIIAPSGLGKTHHILNDIKLKKETNKIIVITPDQNSYNFEKILVEELGATFNIDVVNFSRLCKKLSEITGLDINPLKETNKYFYYLELIKRFEKKENFLINRLVQDFDFIDTISELIDELDEYNITSDKIQEYVVTLDGDSKNKFDDIVELYAEYQNILIENTEYNKRNYIENIITAMEYIDLSEYVFYVDGYYNFAPVEYTLLDKLIKKSNKVVVSVISELDKYTNFKLEKLVKEGDLSDKKYKYLNLEDIRDNNEYSLDIYRKSHEIIAYINSMIIKNKLDKFDIITFYSEGKDRNYKIGLEVVSDNVEVAFREEYLKNRYETEELYFLQEEFRKLSKSYRETEKKNVVIYEAEDIELEVKQLSRNISKELIKNKYSLNDIAILYRDEVYENYEYILRDFGINVHIDKEVSTSNHKLIKLIKNILTYEDKNFKYSILNILKSTAVDFSNRLLSEENLDENLGIEDIESILEYKLVSSLQDLEKDYFTVASDGYTSEQLLVVKVFLQDLALKINLVKKRKKVTHYIKNILEVLEWLNVNVKISQPSVEDKLSLQELEERNKNQQIFDKIVELLKEISKQKTQKLDYITFRKILFILLDKIVYRTIPRSDDYILMSKIDLSKVENKKVIFVLGLNKDILPKNIDSKGIIDDNDKYSLSLFGIELSPRSKSLMIDEDFVAYLALTRAKEKLYLSYSKVNSKYQPQKASMYMDSVLRILDSKDGDNIKQEIESELFFDFEKIENYGKIMQFYSPIEVIYLYKKLQYGENNIDTASNEKLGYLKAVYGELVERLDKKFIFSKDDKLEIIDSIKLEEERYSFSKLKRYEQNPFVYFIENVLNIVQEKDLGISPLLLGSYKHAILEANSLTTYIESKIHEYGREEIDILHLQNYIDSLYPEIKDLIVEIVNQSENKDIRKFVAILENEEINSYIRDNILKDMIKTISIEIYYHLISGYNNYKKEEKFTLNCTSDSIKFKWGNKQVSRIVDSEYDIQPFVFSGIIDRIDEKDGEFLVIDYKSSKTDFDVELFYNNEISQLLVYMLALMLLEDTRIEKIKGIFYRELAKGNKVNKEFRLRGIMNEGLLKDFPNISELAFMRTKKDGSAYAQDQHRVYNDREFEKLVDINIGYLYKLVEKIQKSKYNLETQDLENRSLFNYVVRESIELEKEYEKIATKDFKKLIFENEE